MAFLTFFGQGEKYAPGQGQLWELEDFEANPTSQSITRYYLWERDLKTEYPELPFNGYTNRWVRESFRGTRKARRAASRIEVPVLLLEADDDAFTRKGGNKKFCDRAADCRKVFIPGSKHEILNEKDEFRDQALAEIIQFIKEH